MEGEPKLNPLADTDRRLSLGPSWMWFEDHQEEIRLQFMGEWVAISDTGLVAHATELRELCHQIEGLDERPLIIPVSNNSIPSFMFYLP